MRNKYMWAQDFFPFVTKHPFDGQTDGRTEMPWQQRALHYMQSRGNNTMKCLYIS